MSAGWDAAPARESSQIHGSGTPRVAVRPYYEGLPSMAGRGPDERGRKPAGSGGADALRPSPEVTAPGCKVAAMERREACVLSPERAPRL